MANILHIAAHLGDGAGKAISGLAIADKLNDHTVFLLDAPRKLNHVENCRANGVRVVINGDIETEIAEADVIVINWWGHPLTDEFIASFQQGDSRVVLWMHKNGFYDPPLPDDYKKIADTVMVTSPYSLESEQFKEAALVYGFGDFNPQDLPCKADYSAVSDRFTIGYVGSPTYKKLPDDFLDYCGAVKDAIPDVRFVLIGETDGVIQRDIAKSGLADCFDIRGWVPDVGELLLSFDVFGYLLKPDTFATTENAVLEAMAAGAPVVMTKEPLGKYFVEHEETGFLVSSPREYADVMLRLYSDTHLRERTGKAGRACCVEKYSVERNIAAFGSVITKVIQKDKSIRKTAKGVVSAISKIEPIAGTHRTILADAAPIDTPFSVVIYPTSYCNFKCVYCAHSLKKEEMFTKYEFVSNIEMSISVFERVVWQLREFPKKIKSVMFIGQGEPLLHKNIAEMVRQVKAAGVAEKIELLSNCSLLTPSMSDDLIDAGLDVLRASVQGVTDKKYREICGTKIPFQKIVDNLSYYYSHKGSMELFVKTMDIALESDAERELFYRTFERISDKMFVEVCQPVYSGVEATDGIDVKFDRYGREHAPRRVCPLAFFMLGIFPEGLVVPCDAIYKPVILGDVTKDTLLNMWNSEKLKRFQCAQLEGGRGKNRYCSVCCAPDDVAHPEDDLDARAKEVLERLCVKN